MSRFTYNEKDETNSNLCFMRFNFFTGGDGNLSFCCRRPACPRFAFDCFGGCWGCEPKR